jgi:hypothetical protein
MTRKKGKSVSFDAMVKFFIQHYNIPTKNDIDKMQTRLDRIEQLLKTGGAATGSRPARTGDPEKGAPLTALESVLGIIKRSRDGASFKDIQIKTGFDDKKIRNVIFRLNKMGRIKRKSRGIYVPSP